MAILPVKHLHSGLTGAPALTNTAGSMITVLDACLLNGFNSLSVSSITRSGSTATVTFATAHGYAVNQVVNISGANETEYNGDFFVVSATTNDLTITVSGAPASPATGTITCKTPPLPGWTKAFSGTNKAAYRSTDANGTQLYLRVDDTGTDVANVRGYETMTDVDTGTGLFPTTVQKTTYTWPKKAASQAQEWEVIGDSRLFYYLSRGNCSYSYHCVCWFGDPVSWMRTADVYGCSISAKSEATANWAASCEANVGQYSALNSGYLARGSGQVGASIPFCLTAPHVLYNISYMGGMTGTTVEPYPAPVDNGFRSSEYSLHAGATAGWRATLPGLRGTPHLPFSGHRTYIAGLTNQAAGSLLFVVQVGYSYNVSNPMELFFEVANGWR